MAPDYIEEVMAFLEAEGKYHQEELAKLKEL